MSGTRLLARQWTVTERFRVEIPDRVLLALLRDALAARAAEVADEEPAA